MTSERDMIRKNVYFIDKEISLEDFLKTNCPFIKDSYSLIRENRLELNGTKLISENLIKKKLKEGDKLILLTPESLEPLVNENFEILFEDEYLLIVNKPANLPIHPAGKYYFHTLTELLKRDLKIKNIYPVNRIDRETSGLVILAKSKEIVVKMQKLFLEGKIKKEYLAIIFGKLIDEILVIDKKLKKKQVGEIRDHMVVTTEKDGLISKTLVTRIKSFKKMAGVLAGDYSLVKVNLLTGRRHQIRAHLSSIGHPIVGDKQYGNNQDLFLRYSKDPVLLSEKELVEKIGAKRQLLHCNHLEFIHPETKKLIDIKTGLPKDFINFIEKA